MSRARERFRRVLSGSTCVLAANIFDPLSARIADMLGYEVCVLSGSVGKAANLGVPDIVLSNMSDVVDHCRRIPLWLRSASWSIPKTASAMRSMSGVQYKRWRQPG